MPIDSITGDGPLITLAGGGSAIVYRVQETPGLRASEVTTPIKQGDFYAYLGPVMLVQVESFEGDSCTFYGWAEPGCNLDYLPPEVEAGRVALHVILSPSLYRYLWYREKFYISDKCKEEAGPGAVYIERATGRLVFLSPTPLGGRGGDGLEIEVLADWDVSKDGVWIDQDRFMLFRKGSRVGWASPSTRFDLIE